MKAKKKPLENLTPAALGVDVAPRLKTLKVAEPAGRKAGIKVADVATLVDKLKNEAKVMTPRAACGVTPLEGGRTLRPGKASEFH
jgi:hypothetical protein